MTTPMTGAQAGLQDAVHAVVARHTGAATGAAIKTSASDEEVRERFVASENDAAQECIATTGRHRRRRRRSRCEHKHLSSSFGGSACVMQLMARRATRKATKKCKKGRQKRPAHRMVCGHDGLERGGG